MDFTEVKNTDKVTAKEVNVRSVKRQLLAIGDENKDATSNVTKVVVLCDYVDFIVNSRLIEV